MLLPERPEGEIDLHKTADYLEQVEHLNGELHTYNQGRGTSFHIQDNVYSSKYIPKAIPRFIARKIIQMEDSGVKKSIHDTNEGYLGNSFCVGCVLSELHQTELRTDDKNRKFRWFGDGYMTLVKYFVDKGYITAYSKQGWKKSRDELRDELTFIISGVASDILGKSIYFKPFGSDEWPVKQSLVFRRLAEKYEPKEVEVVNKQDGKEQIQEILDGNIQPEIQDEISKEENPYLVESKQKEIKNANTKLKTSIATAS